MTKPQKGRPPPRNPTFYLDWGQENAKEFIKNANAALAQLLTLSTSLFGGAIAFWNNMPVTESFRYAVVAVLLIAVCLCLFAAMPSEDSFDANDANDIRSYMEELFRAKRTRLRLAQSVVFLALLIIVAGLVNRAYNGVTPTPINLTLPLLAGSRCISLN
jgi:hypothetical protein